MITGITVENEEVPGREAEPEGYSACALQTGSDSTSAVVEDGAGRLGWVLSDTGLTAAIANCTAAEAMCRVVPLGALPCGLVRAESQIQTTCVLPCSCLTHFSQCHIARSPSKFLGRLPQCACRQRQFGCPWLQESEEQGSEQRLLEALPGVLDFISSAGVRAEAAEARPGKVGPATQLRRSELELFRSRTSSSPSESEAGVDNFTHLPGHVPSLSDGCVGDL